MLNRALLLGWIVGAVVLGGPLVGAARGATITEYPTPSPGAILLGITAGPDGALWYTGPNIVGRVTTSGAFTEYRLPTAFSLASGITTGPDGALWFVEGFRVGQIGRITTSGALTEYPIPTGPPGTLAGITAGPDGALWFTESAGNRIGRVTTSGAFTEYPIPTPSSGPEGIVAGPDGALWFTEGVGKIGRVTTSGVFTEYPVPTPGSGPFWIAVGPDGALWFTDSAGKIGRVTTSGAFTEFALPTPNSDARTIAAGPDGALWFTEPFSNKIGRVTTSGAFTEYPIPTPSTFPSGIAAGPDGAVWFTESLGTIGRITVTSPTTTSVSCSPRTFAPGDATVCTATVTDTATSGQSTPSGTVSFTTSGAGGFGGSPCTLSGSGGASASCAVFFTSFPRSGHLITASYGGDATHTESAGRTLVLVAVPESTDGCVVFGHGRITAANGDQASFRGLAVASPPRGAELYRDNGPANPMRVRSTSVDAVTCNADATRASVFGKATINGAASVEYRIDLQLAAGKGGKDSYRIRLSGGYDSVAQPIRHGDVDIRLRNSDHRHHDVNAEQGQSGDNRDGG